MAYSAFLLNVGTLLALIFFASECQAAKVKPANSYFNLCQRKSPDLNECVAKSINSARPWLIKGIPELRLASLEPLFITELTVTEGQGNFRFSQTSKNLSLHGLGQYKVTAADLLLNDTDLNVKLTIKVPHLRMDGNYEMDGQILVLPIRGKGALVLHFGDLDTVCNVRGSIVSRSGKDYADVSDVKWDINVGSANFTFTNLFNGDKMLGDATNNFLNANWKDAFQTYKHLPEEAFGHVFKELTNQVFKRYPVDELFLP